MHLYLARHGEADGDDEGAELTDVGRRQASLLGARLAGTPFAAVRHSPLTRGAQTAALVAAYLPGVPLTADESVGDYVPFAPDPLPDFLADTPPDELTRGARLAAETIARYAVPAGDAPTLLVTHSFLIAWFVRHAIEAPPGRWVGLNAGNAALTVIRYAQTRPPRLVVFNDMAHLAPELRWTGFPDDLRPEAVPP